MAKQTKKHLACYLRCSTQEQNIDMQRREIRAWLKAKGIEGVKWYVDKATGVNTHREAWQKLVAAAHAGKVSQLVFWKLDRVGRNLRDYANLADEFCNLGVGLASVTESALDLSSSQGRAMAGMLAVFAEYENAIRKERQTAGIKAAKARGKKWGGSVQGWSMVKPAKRKKILKLHANGINKQDIAASVGLSWPTVHKIIREGTGQ